LAKLAPTVNLEGREIVVSLDDNQWHIAGFRDPKFKRNQWIPLLSKSVEGRLELSILGPGFIRVGFPAYVELKRGELNRLRKLQDPPELGRWFEEAGKSISKPATLSTSGTPFDVPLIAYAVGCILQRIVEHAHGG
jgi:hypothetical protein